MKLATIKVNGNEKVSLFDESSHRYIDVAEVLTLLEKDDRIAASMLSLIQAGEDGIESVKAVDKWAKDQPTDHKCMYEANEVTVLAPIPRPLKNIMCIGKNYAEHAIEMGSAADIPDHPLVFTKAPTAVNGPDMDVDRHEQVTDELDYEGEIAVIIGKKGKNIAKEHVMDYIFGYTLMNDITGRDLQKRHKQFFLGKSLDTSAPMGPYITYKDDIKDLKQSTLTTKVNGEVRQQAKVEQMIFDIPTIIEVISRGMTLEPGDIIATGTPSGVGKGFNPPRLLQSGDVVEIEVDGLGVLRNTIR